MPIHFPCTHCRKALDAAAAAAGSTVPCPACGGAVAVPTTARPAPPDRPPTPVETQGPRPAARAQVKRRRALVKVGVASLVAVLAAVVAGVAGQAARGRRVETPTVAAVQNGSTQSDPAKVAGVEPADGDAPRVPRGGRPTPAPEPQGPDFASVDYSRGPDGEVLTERVGPCGLYDGYTDPQNQKMKFTSREPGYDRGGEWVRHGLVRVFWDGAMAKKYGEEAWFAGDRHGPIRSWDEFGQQVSEGTYWRGAKHGTFRSWHHTGKPKGVNAWVRGKRHGAFIDYDEAGARLTEATYEDDRLVRVPFETRVEFEALGPFKVKVVTEGYRADGKTFTSHGKATRWMRNAYQTERDDPYRLWAEAEFVDGDQQGKAVSYQEEFVLRDKSRVKTGKLIKAADSGFKGGVKDGPHAAWDDYGNKREDGHYQNGMKVGRWTYSEPGGKSRIVEEGGVGTATPPGPKADLTRTPGGKQPPTDADDAARLQGEWVCVREEAAGVPATPAELAAMGKTLTVIGKRFTIRRAKDGVAGGYDGDFELTPSASPRRFDFASVGGPPWFAGVYELSGDEFRVCYRWAGTPEERKDRATDFKTWKGGSRVLNTFKRVTSSPKVGWTPLFNGKDLAGWKDGSDDRANWTVRDGVLVGGGPRSSYLFTDRDDFSNFHLRAEVKVNDGGNSGVYLRTRFREVNATGYEADINSTHKSRLKSGSIYRAGKPVVTIPESPVPPDQWFTLDVIADGDRIIVKIDGKTTADFTDPTPVAARGHIALQQHNPETVVEFRKIEVAEPTK